MRIGIDLGGTKTEGVVIDENNAIVARLRRPTPQATGYQTILRNIGEIVAELEQRTGSRCHLGIGTPGAISNVTGRLKNSNTVCLNGKPLREDLEGILARPVRIANDANCFALSEATDGAAAGRDMVFGVIMGTGIGGGIICQGQLHQGTQHIAGEWGHNPLENDGPACYCSRRGCVETLLSGPGLLADFQRHGGNSAMDVPSLVAAAEAEDRLAEATIQRWLGRFGRALATVINILDPDAIVLGGGLSNIRRLYDEGRAQVASNVFNDELRTEILPNRHGDSSGVRGAAQLWGAHESA